MEVLEQRQLLSTTLGNVAAKPAAKSSPTFIHPLDASVDTPTGLAATAASSAEIDLSWDAQSSVDGFVILRGTDNITFGTTLDTSGLDGSSTSFHDSTVSAGTKYYYEIEAVASSVDSDPSASVNATTPAAPVPPTGLAATAISSGEIDLSWTAESSVDGFAIKRGTDGITFGTTLVTSGLTGSSVSFHDSTVSSGTKYYYEIASVASSVDSTFSSSVNATTPAPAGPATPAGLAASSISASEIDLSWTAESSVDGFVIKRGTDGITFGTTLDTSGLTGSSTGIHDSTVSAGTKYYYEIESVASSVDSTASAAVSATSRPGKPTVVPTPASSTSVSLAWTAVPGATSYKLEDSADGGTTWKTLTAPGASAISASVTGLTADTAYKFRLTASDAGGAGATSDVVTSTTLLAAPAGLKAKVISKSQIDLSWTATTSSDLASYTLQVSTDGGHTFSELAVLGDTATSAVDTHLTAGTAYSYELIATNDGGDSAASKAVAATTLLASPAGLAATTFSATEIDLAWTADSDTGLTGLKLESSSDGGKTWKTVTTAKASATSFKNTGLVTDTTYIYRLSANNVSGSSKPSSTDSAATLLLAPKALKATTASKTEIDLTWTAVTGATGYTVEKSTDGTTFTSVDTSGLTGTSAGIHVTGLSNGTKYFFHIAAVDDAGTSAFSTAVNATTLLAAPTGLGAPFVLANEVDLSWTADSDAGLTAFKLEESVDGGTTWKTIGAPKASATSFDVLSLTADTAYKFRLSAVSSAGTSDATSAVSKSTLLVAPTGLIAVASSKTAIALGWTAETDATTYKVEQSTNGTDWTDISPTGGSALTGSSTSMTVSGLTAGTAYSFRISGTDADGTSVPSKVASTSTLLGAPAGLAVTSASSTATSLVYTWTADADAGLTGIKAETSSDGGTTWTSLGILKPAVTTLTLTKLTADHLYKVRLSAVNAGGTSTASTAVSGTTLLLAPTDFAVTATKITEVDLSWTAVTDATGYSVLRSADGKTYAALAASSSLAGTDTTFADSTASAGTKYFYEIAPIDAAGTSASSKAVSTTTLLAAPAGLAGTVVSATEVDLTWTADSDTGLTGFKVEASTDGGTTYTVLSAKVKASATGFNATGLIADTTYKFRVSSLSSAGASPSTLTKKTMLAAPVGLAATVASKSEIDLAWTVSSDATTYKVEQSTNGTDWTDISPTGGSALTGSSTSLNVTGLTAGTAYSFRLSATNAVGTSAPATAVSAMTLLDKPTGLAATAVGTNQISLSWTAVASSNLLGYTLQFSLDGSSGWTTVAELDPTATTATDTHLTTATEYFYRLIATDAGGDSLPSTTAHATTS